MVHGNTLSRVYLSLIALLLCVLVLGCGSSPRTGGFITITASGNVVAGTTMQLHATDTNSNKVTSDVTSTATWTSSSPSVATVSSTGLVTGLASGATTITATLRTDTGTLGISIGAPTVSVLSVSPQKATVFTHGTQPYTASATYTDKTMGTPTGIAWSVSPASVATIDGVTGILTAVAPGSYTVTAASGTQIATATGTVTDAPLTSVAITPLAASIASGSTQQFAATGTYADGSTKDLTGSVTWSSSNAAVLFISATGLATASSVSAATSVTLTAHLGTITATLALQVTPGTAVTALHITPTSSSIAAGTSEQHTATALYADGSQKDVTQSVVWSVAASGSAVASISQSGVDTGLAPGTTTIQATLGTTQAQSVVIVTPATLTALTIQAKSSLFPVSTTQQLQLIGSFSDGTTQNLTLAATWQSANLTIATVDAKGLATGLAPGSVQFTASFGGKTATTTGFQVVSPTLVSTVIEINFPNQVLGIGEQLHLLGIYSDGTTHDLTPLATWSSANPAVFPISATGYAYALTAGATQITGIALGKSASTSVSAVVNPLLSIAISPANPSFALGTTLDFTAIGTFGGNLSQDITDSVVWTSSDPSVLTIDGKGRAKSGKPGTATVTASLLGITQTSASITVTSATAVSLSITPATAQIAAHTTQKYTVTGTFTDDSIQDISADVIWSTSDNTVASVDPSGKVTGIKPGVVQVTASLGSITTSSALTVTSATVASVAVLPANSELPVSVNKQFSLIATFSDGTTQDLTQDAVWSTTTPAIASVVMKGKVTGISAGTGIIAAQYGLLSASTPINVTSATIASLAITPASTVIRKSQHQQMVITGTFSDGYTQDLAQLNATFSSGTPTVASIGKSAIAYGVGIGNATINAAFQGKTASTTKFQVESNTVSSVTISPANPSITAGATQQFTVTTTYADGTTDDSTPATTWTSSNPAVLSIDATGLATAHTTTSAVTVTITGTGYFGTATDSVQVQPAPVVPPPPPAITLTSINVTPTSSHLAAGTSGQLTATGTYSDGSTKDLTTTVTWTSSSTGLATVNSTGLVTGVSAGLVEIQAQAATPSGTIQNSAVVRVTNATLTSVSISPSGASFAVGATQQFTLTGHFSDGSTQNLTSTSTWSTSASGVATISTTGLATGVTPGSVQFTGSYGLLSATTAVSMVTPATLVSIAINPSVASFANGTSQQFTIIATYSDGTTHDVTTSATFTSSDPTVVTISAAGLAHGLSTGSAHITATYQGQTITTQSVTITPATLVSIAVTPNSPTLANGTSQQFTATGTFSDSTTQDLSTQVTWNSSNPSVLTINASGLAATGGTGSATITATLNSVTTTTGTVTVTPATLASLTISPTTGHIAKGTSQQFTATGTFTDGTTQNLTTSVTWTTSDGTVVSINAAGLATGTGTGSATLTATYEGQTASTTSFTVTPATLVSIAFTPASPVIAAGTSVQIVVTGTFTDGTTQNLTTDSTFTTSDPTVATVSTAGILTAVAPGNATITVTVGGRTSTLNASITNATLVSLAITPSNPPSFPKGTTQQFTATGTYSDGTTQNLSSTAIWTTSSPAVITIDTHGLATGTGVGSATLTATYQGQTATTAAVQVTPALVASIQVTPANPTIGSVNTQQFTATAIYTDATTVDVTSTTTWTSTNPLVATINASGFATALLPGAATIQAVDGAFTASTTLTVTLTPPPPAATLVSITVTPANTSIVAGASVQYTATATYSDSSTRNITGSVTWASSSTSIATISSSGLAFGASAGTTTIQATSGSVSGTTGLAVTTAPVTLTSLAITPSSTSVAKGMTQQFTATGTYSDGTTQNLTTQVAWQSSVTPVANIDTNGLAHTLAAGTTQISATFSGSTATATLTVSPATISSLAVTPVTASIASGTSQQYKAVGTLSDGSTQDLTNSVTWTSSNTAAATISANGLAFSTTVGSTTITATAAATTATASLNVTSATPVSVQLSPSPVSVPAGAFQQLLATATFTDGSSQDVTRSVTYTTSNALVAIVNANGRLNALLPGTATITATLGSISATLTATVTNATLVSLAITPNPLSLAAGTSQQLTVTGTYSDGSTEDLTTSVLYASTNPLVASVSLGGNVTVLTTGNATILVTSGTVTSGLVTSSVAVTGTTAIVTGITVSPASVTLASGQTQQFAATATLSNGTQQNVTASAHWSVSDPSKATVGDSGMTKGFLTSNAPGTISVVATSGSASGSATVTIQPASLTSLTVAPNPLSLPAGTTQALTVTGHYTDGSMADLTASATFTSNNASAAAVDASGLVQAVSPGTASITSTVHGVSVSLSVTVTAAVLTSIAISPSAPSLTAGLTLQLTAIGTYSDGSTADLSAQVQWTSTAPSVATISGTGLLTGIATGNSTVGAAYRGVTATAPVTITAAILQSIAILPVSASFPLGLSQQLTAIGTWSDGTTHDITSTVTWSSQTPSIGIVSATGLATGVTTGTFTAVATKGTITGSAPVTVTAAILQSIVVTPANQTYINLFSTHQQFTATGHYTDGTTQNITTSVHWAITQGISVGNINQQGVFSTTGVGVGTVTATSAAISGSTGFIVVSAF